MFKKFLKDITGITAAEKEMAEQFEREEKARLRREKREAKKLKDEENKRKQAEIEAEKLKSLSPKEVATMNNEPYVNVIALDLDPENMHEGAFELDWNEKFVSNLIRAGYQMKDTDTDADIVDRWFQNICRHVVLETWEQEQAMNPNRVVKSRDLGDGFSEVS